MTDKELLKYAAKAAGIKLAFDDTDAGLPEMAFDIARGVYWNALKDDGDALRLAVKLKLHVLLFGSLTTVNGYYFKDGFSGFDERHDDNPCAATRRAIVRAAAEIGKEMK